MLAAAQRCALYAAESCCLRLLLLLLLSLLLFAASSPLATTTLPLATTATTAAACCYALLPAQTRETTLLLFEIAGFLTGAHTPGSKACLCSYTGQTAVQGSKHQQAASRIVPHNKCLLQLDNQNSSCITPFLWLL